MYCPRLDHFVRFNFDGSISRCGHMINAPQWKTLQQMDSSEWLTNARASMAQDSWPSECIRCKESENIGNKSIRQHSLDIHAQLLDARSDYLVLGGVLDNVCNSACQTCNEKLSTKIGSLRSKEYIKINNSELIDTLPVERIVQMDINGGEPSASPNYLKLLQNLPPNVKYLRVNTNGSKLITALPDLVKRGVKVTVTVSLDGIGRGYDYVRWPIKWQDVEQNIQAYQAMGLHELNTWTTVSALNIGDLKNIFSYVQQHNLKNSWALIENPSVLNVKHSNHLSRTADVPDELQSIVATGEDNTVELQLWIAAQDQLRGIVRWDYYR
jgi:sulfatase maturation enzyme AslB (radical SAM superfamily)